MVIFKMSFSERIHLKLVNSNYIEYLYDLLKERDSSITITQTQLPTFSEHKNFVQNQIKSVSGDNEKIKIMGLDPYLGWYIISSNEVNLGSIWIEEDGNIGLQIQKKFQNFGIGVIAFQKIQTLHPREHYKTTVSQENYDSQKFCKTLGFELLQETSDRIIFHKINPNYKTS